MQMDAIETELELAREELAFWRDFVVWWGRERDDTSASRLQAMLECAERRNARALRLRQMADLH